MTKYVIIGGVACGPKTAATLARRIPDAEIKLFQKEEILSYATCGMPYFASGDINSWQELVQTSYGKARDVDFFKNSKGFDVVTNSAVIRIDRQRKIVVVKNLISGEQFEESYDKLIITTGAVPSRPPFSVAESDNIRSFTKPEDAIHFRKSAETGQVGSVLVIGGGFIGCEMVEAAAGLWGLDVTLVEKENQILPLVLDSEMAAIAEREMSRQGVKIITGARVLGVEINSEGNPEATIEGHDKITADYCFLALGVKPQIKLAQDCGLTIGITGGIKVNSQMMTSDPDIYAGGDCVESTHHVSGKKLIIPMGSLANRHGRVIAENLAGNSVHFPAVTGAFLIKIFDRNVGSVGLTYSETINAGFKAQSVWGAFPDKPDYYPESKAFSLKMTYDTKSNRLLGLQAVGEGDICSSINVFSSFLQKKSTLDDLMQFEHGYAPPFSEALDPLHHLAALAQAQQNGINILPPDNQFSEKNDAVIWLDVREADEIKARPWTYLNKERGDQLITIPLNDLFGNAVQLDCNKEIIVVCQRGPRSYQAVLNLKTLGFEKVSFVGGGTKAALS